MVYLKIPKGNEAHEDITFIHIHKYIQDDKIVTILQRRSCTISDNYIGQSDHYTCSSPAKKGNDMLKAS